MTVINRSRIRLVIVTFAVIIFTVAHVFITLFNWYSLKGVNQSSVKCGDQFYCEFWKWELNLSSGGNISLLPIIATTTNNPDQKEEDEEPMDEFRRHLHNKSLWGLDFKKGHYGLDRDYDDRFLLQKIWQLRAAQIQPQIFAENKTKVILLMQSFGWWNYQGGQVLSCAGPFDKRCLLVDKYVQPPYQGPVDAIITTTNFGGEPSVSHESNVFRIFYSMESPFHSGSVDLVRPRDMFTSYWRGSNFYYPYFKWLYYDPAVRSKPQAVNYAAGKTNMVAIFVSNCHSPNNRMTYVHELKNHIDVHVYGACGDHQCSRAVENVCFATLKKHYRFYLAFENSNCRDYITEKLFQNAFQNDLIPVVMGAHPDDYAAVAPHNSYIHVEDFSGPADLAAYLKELARDEKAYNKYFEWKGTGEFVNRDLFCRICSFLFYSDTLSPNVWKSKKMKKKRPSFVWSTHSEAEEPMCLRDRRYWTRSDHPVSNSSKNIDTNIIT